ncbi:hypothetical protein AAVH_17004 [Aphelenchoides avenae]|nr:hypothetical protein AAVH_17004 [Aphelenchus avenae]
MTLNALLSGDFEAALEAAFDESPEQLVFRCTFPHSEFLQKLVEKFVAYENPPRLRQVLLISENDLREATSASFHLPQVYDTIFPCALCTSYRTENETNHTFVEVFHFRNRNDTSVCATVSFHMPAVHDTNDYTTSDSRVEMCLTRSCRTQRSPSARPSRKLFTQFDTFFGVLQEVNPDGLEKLKAASQGWRATIDRHKRALPRRKVLANISFYGEHPTVVTVIISRYNGEYDQIIRVLVPRSPEQLSRMLLEHLRDALVTFEFVSSEDSFRLSPQGTMFRSDPSKALVWTIRLFQSLKRTQVERVSADSELFGTDNLPVVMKAARCSCRVGVFDLFNFSVEDEFTMPEVVDLLRDPTAVASDKIVVRTWTPTDTDYSMLEDFLFSTTTPAFKLRLYKWPERFLDATDTTNVIREFYLILYDFDGAAFVDLPPTNRMKQFKHDQDGKKETVRVHTYRNAHTGEALSVARHADRTHDSRILFLKGQIALDEFRNKWTDDRTD